MLKFEDLYDQPKCVDLFIENLNIIISNYTQEKFISILSTWDTVKLVNVRQRVNELFKYQFSLKNEFTIKNRKGENTNKSLSKDIYNLSNYYLDKIIGKDFNLIYNVCILPTFYLDLLSLINEVREMGDDRSKHEKETAEMMAKMCAKMDMITKKLGKLEKIDAFEAAIDNLTSKSNKNTNCIKLIENEIEILKKNRYRKDNVYSSLIRGSNPKKRAQAEMDRSTGDQLNASFANHAANLEGSNINKPKPKATVTGFKSNSQLQSMEQDKKIWIYFGDIQLNANDQYVFKALDESQLTYFDVEEIKVAHKRFR